MVETLKSYLLIVWNYPGVAFIILGVLLNLVAAIAVALRTGKFSFQVLGQFLVNELAPFVLVYAAFALVGDAAGFAWVGPAVFILIQTMIVASILDKLRQLGVPIPAKLTSMIEKPPA